MPLDDSYLATLASCDGYGSGPTSLLGTSSSSRAALRPLQANAEEKVADNNATMVTSRGSPVSELETWSRLRARRSTFLRIYAALYDVSALSRKLSPSLGRAAAGWRARAMRPGKHLLDARRAQDGWS
ncbi:uncharacterized protein PAN0_009c3696 [Moesziomyces antarcticus]|nr:uncharacterized protein PAN0_009c3696 [Moesziomyces antarcticus]GAK65479.1 hypothetical protein PAN0_009c3696 [Moesziomyces antarcticus]